jgi:hypothetical protein
MPAAEHAEFLKQHYIRSKANLPFIKFHEDMIARIMGLVPGDIVESRGPRPHLECTKHTEYVCLRPTNISNVRLPPTRELF